ncbi:Gfo/Idh/MocA family oxidoreductase [Corynebacterium bovis]|uniref:Gfo/Idh/MocA family protein n=2 Tax=Corynebacterium bovis TaxID=36808 RepID=UPI003139C595
MSHDTTPSSTTSPTTTGRPPVRFAVVGAGQIAQQAFIPGLAHLPEAELAALVTSDPAKGERHGVPAHPYEAYGELLASGDVDAVYVATPVTHHRRYAVEALDAGVPVLLEKPMAPSVEDCQAIIDAAERSGTTLMVGYRMHQDAFLVDLADLARSGSLGDLRTFTATFGHTVNPDNHRSHTGFWGGPLPDLGIYPLNTVRTVFGEEPVTVQAHGVHHAGTGLGVTPTVAVTLGFPGGRSAQFTASYATASVETFTLTGSQGSVTSTAAFMWGAELAYTVDTGDGPRRRTYPAVDQFAGETRYFVHCVREGLRPEPDGEEGLLDIRVCEAVAASLESGSVQTLAPAHRSRRVSRDQVVGIPATPAPAPGDLVGIVPEES